MHNMRNFLENIGEFLADNWMTILLSAATAILVNLWLRSL